MREAKVVTCTFTECNKKDCPNHTYLLQKNSFTYSDCMYHPLFKRNSRAKTEVK